jgi:hypothetical protein
MAARTTLTRDWWLLLCGRLASDGQYPPPLKRLSPTAFRASARPIADLPRPDASASGSDAAFFFPNSTLVIADGTHCHDSPNWANLAGRPDKNSYTLS